MTQPGSRTKSDQALATAASLVIDAMTAEVVSAFGTRGIRAIVLKGPSFARWLYPNGGFRPYVDADLLISHDDYEAAQDGLRQLGFLYGFEARGPEDGLPEGLGWQRGPAEVVDLHQTIKGAEADPATVWRVLSQLTDTQVIGGLEVEVLSAQARAVHVALHAARPATGRDQAIQDLTLALELVSIEDWRSAAEIATGLDAIPAFVTGLRLLPRGRALADTLDLQSDASIRTRLIAAGPPGPALSLEELARTRGLPAKLGFLWRKLFPSEAFMRALYPLARRGRIGLALAHCRRIVSRVLHLPAAILAVRRARRADS